MKLRPGLRALACAAGAFAAADRAGDFPRLTETGGGSEAVAVAGSADLIKPARENRRVEATLLEFRP